MFAERPACAGQTVLRRMVGFALALAVVIGNEQKGDRAAFVDVSARDIIIRAQFAQRAGRERLRIPLPPVAERDGQFRQSGMGGHALAFAGSGQVLRECGSEQQKKQQARMRPTIGHDEIVLYAAFIWQVASSDFIQVDSPLVSNTQVIAEGDSPL